MIPFVLVNPSWYFNENIFLIMNFPGFITNKTQ